MKKGIFREIYETWQKTFGTRDIPEYFAGRFYTSACAASTCNKFHPSSLSDILSTLSARAHRNPLFKDGSLGRTLQLNCPRIAEISIRDQFRRSDKKAFYDEVLAHKWGLFYSTGMAYDIWHDLLRRNARYPTDFATPIFAELPFLIELIMGRLNIRLETKPVQLGNVQGVWRRERQKDSVVLSSCLVIHSLMRGYRGVPKENEQAFPSPRELTSNDAYRVRNDRLLTWKISSARENGWSPATGMVITIYTDIARI